MKNEGAGGKIIESHVRSEPLGRSLLLSALGHLLLFVAALAAVQMFEPALIRIGGGLPPGSGRLIEVKLAGELSGGAGMYKPGIVARPEVAPAVVGKPPPSPVEKGPVFEETSPPARVPRKSSHPGDKRSEISPGSIPQAPEPGSGGRPGGGGGGAVSAAGVLVGTGGGPGVDSWYVRQVEQRVGRNWLKTTLSGLRVAVRTTIRFDVARNGRILNIRIQESSGIQSVDLAAQRAVRASDPLPPLPLELRRRSVRFVAVFAYPPR